MLVKVFWQVLTVVVRSQISSGCLEWVQQLVSMLEPEEQEPKYLEILCRKFEWVLLELELPSLFQ